MGVSGDFAALRELRDRLGDDRIRAMVPELAKRIGAAAVKQLADEFVQGRDPYGAAWKETQRGNKPLRRTGRMALSVTAQATGPNVKVTVGTTYAVYHQDGTRAHERKGAAVPVDRRGRFVSKSKLSPKARRQAIKIIRAHKAGGIPRRQMLPTASTGGVGPIWGAAFREEERAVVTRVLRGR